MRGRSVEVSQHASKLNAASARQAEYADMVKTGATARGRFFMTGNAAGYVSEKQAIPKSKPLLQVSAELMEKIDQVQGIDSKNKESLVNTLDNILREKLGIYPEEDAALLERYSKHSNHVRKCKRCGKYFIPVKETTWYCSRISESGRPCTQKAGGKNYRKKVEESELLTEYERFYYRIRHRFNTGKITMEEYDELILLAKTRRNAILRDYGEQPPEDVVKEYAAALRKQQSPG